jgi:toxin ParE1/3/4
MEVVIAPQARRDIASILAWTEEHFGSRILTGYANLIASAIEHIADDPNRTGSIQRTEIAENCRTYHLNSSRNSAARTGIRIRQPRHFLLYRTIEPNTVEIGRVLHDSMDITANLPDEYRG